MPRVKISEFKAKKLITLNLGLNYSGLSVDSENYQSEIQNLSENSKYVIKVDQGIKKRNKLGLVFVEVEKSQLNEKVRELQEKGYSNFLIEEFVPHSPSEEKFIAMERTRDGILCHYTNSGGVNVEDAKESIMSAVLTKSSVPEIAKSLELNPNTLQDLVLQFDKLHLTFLESNPFIVKDGQPLLLDLAVEVDSAADFFVNGLWNKDDIVDTQKNIEPEEKEIKNLAATSSASFKLVVLNPQGSIFTIFSGGGASIVLADEINNIGHGSKLANYAEYSGGPTEEETYIFTKNIVSLALRSPAQNKKIYIAGGVANFTDIRATFKGVIKALDETKEELKNQNIKVYVRRGGPYQEEGLSLMKNFLDQAGLLGEVMGPDRVLTEVITNN
jgi:succinyl-CoA synthetase beta subunit